MVGKVFTSREEAALQLVNKLKKYKGKKDAVIIALPRGGVVLGNILAKELNLPLDIMAPRKIGAPDNPELAIGAICEGKVFVNTNMVRMLGINSVYIEKVSEEEKEEEERRVNLYRKKKKPLDLKGKLVIIVDDGIATGATIRVAIDAIKHHRPAKIVVAIPVASPDSVQVLKEEVKEVICLQTPAEFMAISQFYKDFPQVTDETVIKLLQGK